MYRYYHLYEANLQHCKEHLIYFEPDKLKKIFNVGKM